MEKCSKKTGFTLIELLVVVAIIGVLVGMIMGVTSVAQRKAYEGRVKADLVKIKNALEEYRIEYGKYPTNAFPEDSENLAGNLWNRPQNEGLKPFLVMKGWTNATEEYDLQDPSGNDYRYLRRSTRPYADNHDMYDLWAVKQTSSGEVVFVANWLGDF
jgi:type II secretion system protein G